MWLFDASFKERLVGLPQKQRSHDNCQCLAKYPAKWAALRMCVTASTSATNTRFLGVSEKQHSKRTQSLLFSLWLLKQTTPLQELYSHVSRQSLSFDSVVYESMSVKTPPHCREHSLAMCRRNVSPVGTIELWRSQVSAFCWGRKSRRRYLENRTFIRVPLKNFGR